MVLWEVNDVEILPLSCGKDSDQFPDPVLSVRADEGEDNVLLVLHVEDGELVVPGPAGHPGHVTQPLSPHHLAFPDNNYSVMQSVGNSFEDIVSDSFNKLSWDENSILDQTYKRKYVRIIIIMILILYNII